MARLSRYPALDGLRGLAMAGVVFSHLPLSTNNDLYNRLWQGAQAIRLSNIALDTFFLLSGFFITRLLLEERAANGRISLSTFYKRRALRIFPIYYLTLFVCWVLFRMDVASVLSIFTYTFNMYHAAFPIPNPMEHSWSLSVEEQYYLIWPLAVSLIPLRAMKWVTALFVPVFAILFGLSISTDIGNGDQLLSGNIVYMSLLTRMLTLSLGGWLAVRVFEGRRLEGWKAAAGGAGAILLLAFDRLARDHGVVIWQGTYWTIAIAGYGLLSLSLVSTLVLGAGWIAVALRWLLAQQPLRALGQISYAGYLYHLPVLYYFGLNEAAMAGGTAPMSTIALALGITLLLAITSFYLIERPILAFRDSRRQQKPMAGAT
jgi:peptidoglycan/LPS O-acetylase OafA/YrhL